MEIFLATSTNRSLPRGDVAARLLLTAVLGAGVLGLSHVPLPLVKLRLYAAFTEGQALDLVSVGALGITPWVVAYALVEIASVVVPPWRLLRATPQGRARLEGATRWLWLLAVASQSFAMCVGLEQMSIGGQDLLMDFYGVERWVVMCTLVAGSALVGLAAAAIRARGIGGGFAVLLALGLGAELWRDQGLFGSQAVALSWAVSAAGTLLLLRSQPRSETLPLSVAGVLPLHLSSTLLGILMLLNGEVEMVASPLGMLLLALLTWVLAALFFPYAGAGAASGVSEHAWSRSRFVSVAGNALLLGCVVQLTAAIELGTTVLLVAPLVAVVLDIMDEAKVRSQHPNLVSVWPLHEVRTADASLHALRTAGITAHVRGRNLRLLLHFFAPYAPMHLLVSTTDAERATQVLSERLHSR